jgi:hypothetical protein
MAGLLAPDEVGNSRMGGGSAEWPWAELPEWWLSGLWQTAVLARGLTA